jgi:hypothetical protein
MVWLSVGSRKRLIKHDQTIATRDPKVTEGGGEINLSHPNLEISAFAYRIIH